MVKKLTGSVMDVFNAQGHEKSVVNDFERNRGESENASVIERDVPRTALADFTGKTFNDFYNEVHRPSVYQEHYIQGNLDGGTTLDIYDIYKGMKVKALYEELDKLPNSPEKIIKEQQASEFFNGWTQHRRSLRLAYRDDLGNLCAIGLVFNKEKPNNWALQIVRNTTAPLAERNATLFAQGEIVSTEKASDIEASKLPQELSTALGSEKMNALLSGLVNEKGEIVLEKFEELEERIKSNQNIDNRDVKKIQLKEFMSHAEKILPDDAILQKYFTEINSRSSSDVDFFKAGNFEETLNELFVKVSTQLEQLEDQEKAKIAFLNTKLIYYAIQLELKAFPLYEESQAILRDTYMGQAQKLRDLRDDPLSEKDKYKDMFFSQLNNQVEVLAAKRTKLSQFVKIAKQKCGDDAEALAYAKELESNIHRDIDSYTDKRLDFTLDIAGKQLDVFLGQRALILHDKIMDFAGKLERHAATLSDEEMSQGVLEKAKSLRGLSDKQSQKYRNLDFNEVLSETVTEISNAQFKKEFLEQLKSYAGTLPDNAPPFLLQRIKDKAEALQDISPEQIVELYKDKDFKVAAAEIVTYLFQDEKVKQETGIRNQLKKELEMAKPSTPEDQGFFRRNRTSLIIGTLGVLAFVSLILTLSGVLAPLGIALGTATAIATGMAGAVTAGAVAVGAGTQVANNEVQFSDDKKEYMEEEQSYKKKVASFNADYAQAVEKFRASYSDTQSKFMKEHFKVKSDSIPDDLHSVEVGVSVDRDVAPNLEEVASDIDETIPELEGTDELEQAKLQLAIGEASVSEGLRTSVKQPIIVTPVSSQSVGGEIHKEQAVEEVTTTLSK